MTHWVMEHHGLGIGREGGLLRKDTFDFFFFFCFYASACTVDQHNRRLLFHFQIGLVFRMDKNWI